MQVVDENFVVFNQPMECCIEERFQILLLVQRLEIGDQEVLRLLWPVELVICLLYTSDAADE